MTYIVDIDPTRPDGATDDFRDGDNEIRQFKTDVKGSFPNLGSTAVTKTAAQINNAADEDDVVLRNGSQGMTGNLVVSGSASPSVIVKPSLGSGFPQFVIQNINGTIAATLFVVEGTGELVLRREDGAGNVQTSIHFDADGNARLQNSVSAAGVPSADAHIANKKYVDDSFTAQSITNTNIADDTIKAIKINKLTDTGTGTVDNGVTFVFPAGFISANIDGNGLLEAHDGTNWVSVTGTNAGGSHAMFSNAANFRVRGDDAITLCSYRYIRQGY